MKNQVSRGQVVTMAAPHDCRSGDGVLIGSIFGVAVADAKQGDDVAFGLEGVFDLPKAAVEINQGDPIYWNAGAKQATTVAEGNVKIGAAVTYASAPAATVNTRLNGSF